MRTEPLRKRSVAQNDTSGISAGQRTRVPPGHKRCCWPWWTACHFPLQLSKPQTQGFLSPWASQQLLVLYLDGVYQEDTRLLSSSTCWCLGPDRMRRAGPSPSHQSHRLRGNSLEGRARTGLTYPRIYTHPRAIVLTLKYPFPLARAQFKTP